MCQWIKTLNISCECGHNVYVVHPILNLKKCVFCGRITEVNGYEL